MMVCAAPAYLAEHGWPETLEDLTSHHAITYVRAGQLRTWQFPFDEGPPREATPPSRLRFDDLEAITDAAEAGYGLAWLPCWLIRDRVRAGTLVPVLTAIPGLVFTSHALWPQSPHLASRVRLAIDALAAELPGAAEL
jgi:DNA-binding transcriptional LysR family regulator